MQLVFAIPDDDAPGYLTREKQRLVFLQAMKTGQSPESVDAMVKFLAQFVSEPADVDGKEQALWLASKRQFRGLLESLGGDTDNAGNPT